MSSLRNTHSPGLALVLVALIMIGCDTKMPQTQSETLYDQVVAAGKIRVAYVTYPPGCIKDPNTNELSGIFVETLEKAGENLSLEIEWVEEVGWGTMIEGLQADRYDLIGSPVWANSSRGKLVDFSIPLFYSGIGIYVRVSEERFDSHIEVIDDPTIKISTIDGEMSHIIAATEFPNAETISLSQLSDVSQLFLEITQNKADVTFAEPYIAFEYLQNNPGTIKNIAAQKPIRIFPNTMMFKRGEGEFKSMLDTALAELINQGYVDDLLRDYEPFPGAFYRVASPYAVLAGTE